MTGCGMPYPWSMTDRESRDRLALSLRRLASGRITSDEFDYDAYVPFRNRTDDPALSELSTYGWLHYSSGLFTYRLRGRRALSKDARKSIARAVLFLKTNQEYKFEELLADESIEHGVSARRFIIFGAATSATVLIAIFAFELFLILFSIALSVAIIALIGATMVSMGRDAIQQLRLKRYLFQHPPLEGTFWPYLDERASMERHRYWPFASKQDYEAALGKPPFLNGKMRLRAAVGVSEKPAGEESP